MIISHQHIDHLGLVSLVDGRAGAEVAAVDAAVPFVQQFAENAEADDEFALQIMLANGTPADVASALQSVSRAFRAWGHRADVRRTPHHGDVLELRDRHLERSCTAPPTPPPTPSFTTPNGGC